MSPYHVAATIFLWLTVALGNAATQIVLPQADPDINLSTPDIIRRHGFPAETHTVQTADGYLLGVHRIPPADHTPRPVVFLQHGILGSSADWILTGPKKGLGFLLVEKGYDVWIGNTRGNTYSKAHVSLQPKDPAFWKFSWDQIAEYDLTATIDYILMVTKVGKIDYIGHSMGTTVFFALMSSRPEYNDKVHLMVALAPVAQVTHMKCPLRLLQPWVNDLQFMERILGNGELLPQNKILKYLAEYLCDSGHVEAAICSNILFILAGYDKPQLNEVSNGPQKFLTILPVILSHTPAGTSSSTAIQYAQQIKSGRFSKFDFGPKGNQRAYNASIPPLYELEKITTPVALFFSDNDLFVSRVDLDLLTARLSAIVDSYEVPYKAFNHLDYIYATDAPTLVYSRVFHVLAEHGQMVRQHHKKTQSFQPGNDTSTILVLMVR